MATFRFYLYMCFFPTHPRFTDFIRAPIDFRIESLRYASAQLNAGFHLKVCFSCSTKPFNAQVQQIIAHFCYLCRVKHGQLAVASFESTRRRLLEFVIPFALDDEPANPFFFRYFRWRQELPPGLDPQPCQWKYLVRNAVPA